MNGQLQVGLSSMSSSVVSINSCRPPPPTNCRQDHAGAIPHHSSRLDCHQRFPYQTFNRNSHTLHLSRRHHHCGLRRARRHPQRGLHRSQMGKTQSRHTHPPTRGCRRQRPQQRLYYSQYPQSCDDFKQQSAIRSCDRKRPVCGRKSLAPWFYESRLHGSHVRRHLPRGLHERHLPRGFGSSYQHHPGMYCILSELMGGEDVAR